jgi:hypothetical protein
MRQSRLPDLGPLICIGRILPVDLNSGGTIKSNSLIRLDSAAGGGAFDMNLNTLTKKWLNQIFCSSALRLFWLVARQLTFNL